MDKISQEIKNHMLHQIACVEAFKNTPHDGGPGLRHEAQKWHMIIETCKVVAAIYQIQVDNMEMQEEMKAWDAIDDSVEWDSQTEPLHRVEPEPYHFKVSNWTRSGTRDFSSLKELLDFIQETRTTCAISYDENGLYLHIIGHGPIPMKEEPDETP